MPSPPVPKTPGKDSHIKPATKERTYDFSTPARPDVQKYVTPSRQGTSEKAQSRADKTTAPEMQKLVRKEISFDEGNRRRTTFEAMVEFLIEKCNNSGNSSDFMFKAVMKECIEFCNKEDVREALAKHITEFCKPKKLEKNLYEPFVNIVNTIMEKLEEHQKPFNDLRLNEINDLKARLFCLDPKRVTQSYNTRYSEAEVSQRSPDLVFFPKEVWMLARHKVKTSKSKESKESKEPLKPMEPPKPMEPLGCQWGNILSPVEGKLGSRKGINGDIFTSKEPYKYESLKPSFVYDYFDDGAPNESKTVHEDGMWKFVKEASRPFPPRKNGGDLEVRESKQETVRAREVEQAQANYEHVTTGSKRKLGRGELPDNVGEGSLSTFGSSLKDSIYSASNSSKMQKIEEEKEIPRDANAQNATYACEMLNRGLFPLYSINPLFIDEVVYLWWFDRQNAIETTGLNIIWDMPFFVALLVAFQRFTPENWGIFSDFAPASIFTSLGPKVNQEPVNIKFDNILATTIPEPDVGRPAPDLKGRGTWIVLAQSTSYDPVSKSDLSMKPLVIKACWPEKSRYNEALVIRYAKATLENKPETKAFVDNMPQLFGSRDVEGSDTFLVIKGLKLQPPEKDPESRILRLHLFSRLVPVNKIEIPRVFEKAWIDCFKCHYALWNRGIEHGDISIWNLMWDNSVNKKCGVLNDWDLAYVRGGIRYEGETVVYEGKGHERTGTLPFMARDLLENRVQGESSTEIERLYRHEVESFIWVFVWWCLTPGENEQDKYPVEATMLNKWCTGTFAEIRDSKVSYLDRTRINPGIVSDEMWLKLDLLCWVLDIINSRRKKKRGRFEEPSEDNVHRAVLDIMGGNIVEDHQIKRVLFPK